MLFGTPFSFNDVIYQCMKRDAYGFHRRMTKGSRIKGVMFFGGDLNNNSKKTMSSYLQK